MRKRWLICFTATLALASWGCSNDEEALETPIGVGTTVEAGGTGETKPVETNQVEATTNDTAETDATIVDASETEEETTAKVSSESEFEIDEEGTLVKYIGPGGHVVIPETVKAIKESAFEDCDRITSIEIPEGITALEFKTFAKCYKLETVKLPSTLVVIGTSAFEACGMLETIEIPESVETIGQTAFRFCYGLKEIDIPDKVTYIGPGAFFECKELENVKLPKGLVQITNNTFEACGKLTSLEIYSNLGKICENAFSGCSNVSDIKINGDKTVWENIIIESGNDILTNVNLNYSEEDVVEPITEAVQNAVQVVTANEKYTDEEANSYSASVDIYLENNDGINAVSFAMTYEDTALSMSDDEIATLKIKDDSGDVFSYELEYADSKLVYQNENNALFDKIINNSELTCAISITSDTAETKKVYRFTTSNEGLDTVDFNSMKD